MSGSTMDTAVKYLGMSLQSPIIVGASSLTGTMDNLLEMEQAGAGAVVVKPLFEEQIIFDIKCNQKIFAPTGHYGENYALVEQTMPRDVVQNHFAFIHEAKQKLHIPVIGCLDCYQFESWINYAKRFQDAGCDALEINMSLFPYETNTSVEDFDRLFQNVISSLRRFVSIPISIRVTPYYTDMSKALMQLSWMGIQGVTVFGEQPLVDVDVETEEIGVASGRNLENRFEDTLRWTGVLSDKLRCGICSAGGVRTSEDVVKLLLCGAQAIQVSECLKENGIKHLGTLNEGLVAWMERHNYDKIDLFRGKLAVKGATKAGMQMRVRSIRNLWDVE